MKQSFVYILASKRNGTLYVGVTSNLVKRIYEHKQGTASIFTKRYNCKFLVYYELHSSIENAIRREKEIKVWKRIRKIKLINSINKEWKDLYKSIVF